MVRKKSKNKDKERSPSPTPKALSEHSDEIKKAQIKPQNQNQTDLKNWIEQLSQSPEVIKALQGMASSSGASGMDLNPKAIVPAYGATSLSPTVEPAA